VQVHETLPPLARDTGFWGMAVTQFLGAFNDNLFKQLVLLLATPTTAQLAAGTVPDRQAEAMIVFAGAFLIFSGYAGWLSERFSKRSIVIACKVAEIAVMIVGTIGFFYYNVFGLWGMMTVLFFMGLHSAFFGPAKYGILPEMIRERDLPRANGIFLMFTFLAIVFGTALAGIMSNTVESVWRWSIVCVLIAVLGTITALWVRRVPPANPIARVRWSDAFVPPEMLRLVIANRQLLLALIVTSLFWLLGGVVQQAVNALGKSQLGLNDGWTSALTAMLGIGIPFGCLLGGYLSRGSINARVVAVGATGIVVCLGLLSLRGGPHQHLLGFWGTAPVLALLGVCTGMFIVPVQVSLQALPPAGEKGRTIALMNQCNWIGIIVGAILFKLCTIALDYTDQPRNVVFGVTALLMLPVALFYRPKEQRLT
jgi:acyl-[acyl-carrier-protein]-phospholipid O-acyltransferase/long-chain-fatty-acid--[acyl-carrier-protein] ligase